MTLNGEMALILRYFTKCGNGDHHCKMYEHTKGRTSVQTITW